MKTLFVTGGAGFIGGHFVRLLLPSSDWRLVNIDKLTYASDLEFVCDCEQDARYTCIQGDICDEQLLADCFHKEQPEGVVHFAAESHVDRSIDTPSDFIQTNIRGTFALLEAARTYWKGLSTERQHAFRFLHISTDEVYGSLEAGDLPFTEETPYAPNSPYAASKAAADHLVRAYCHTYGLPTLLTHASNNYGPYHFPEKLIPLMICRALAGQSLPIYGEGNQVRDWVYVEDHCRALLKVLQTGHVGAVYNIGGKSERTNLAVVQQVCELLDRQEPRADGRSYREQIVFVADRPGHDKRYAIDTTKIEKSLQWEPLESFESGMEKTVAWYLAHRGWCQRRMERGNYRGERLGKGR